ncbi:aminotransferase [Corynebacterium jeikeium]|uniref:Aromatic amino acid aminotransferase n=1 Tax=Corynebacterium jeikeium (strain K411) TaxID=306537 RepID=PATR_CORJK|nr:histidinol-phosphate transaminase [Corynebacterium jeikeium]Q4JSJ5.1 RecName: Full=Putative phenylalanine aminotransferase [Corynebacterium jeikeium K411]CAI38212.1 phenylalanine aminotransferase [Corynebacterium jeikeium K411]SUY84437.1 aminotransferase [Corynebacterium jeikeium]
MIRPDLSSLPAYVPGSTQPGALKLASNESSLSPLPSVSAVINDATSNLNRYPDMASGALRGKLAQWLGVDLDNVAVGNGSSALCQQLVQATCKDGDEVVYAWRSFEAYPILCKIAGAVGVGVPLKSGRHDLKAMSEAIGERTRLVFVCNPNNPTGTTVSRDEFREFMGRVPADVTVVLDEAYVEYNRDAESPVALEELQRYPNLAVCRTFSKAYGLAGLRLGYLVGPAELVEAVNKVGIPFGVNALAQAAGIASVEAQGELAERVDATVAERERVEAYLAGVAPAGADEPLTYPSQANFVWLNAGERAEALDEALKREGVIARCFAGEGVRVTVTTAEETDVLLRALERALPAVGLVEAGAESAGLQASPQAD